MTVVTPEHEHFGKAARRHRDDAQHLSAATRIANADHLLGLGVECVIKSLLLNLGHASSSQAGARPELPVQGGRSKKLSHMPGIATEVAAHLHGRGTTQFVASVHQAAAVYANWDVADRYRDGGHVTAAMFQARETAAAAVYGAADASLLQGVLV